MNPRILVLDMEFRADKTIEDIGVSWIIDGAEDQYLAARPEKHYLIRIGDEKPKSTLAEACYIIERMGTKNLMWASYGVSDRHALKRETESAGLDMPVGYFHIDIGPVYAAMMGLDQPVKLKKAAEELTGRYYGAQHHADDDAWNAARVLAAIMNRFDRS